MIAAHRTRNTVKKADKRLRPTTLFGHTSKYSKHVPSTLEQWEQNFKDFNNWVRLSAAMAINGYMELYLRKICSLAVESNPGIIIGAPGAIDGAALLKTRPDYGYPDYAVHLVKGDWGNRLAFYEKMFGEAPAKLKEHLKELNELRKMRNGVGHSFGRSVDDYESGLHLHIKPMMRLSEDRFNHWLRMADEVALAIDNHLKDTHIGHYELLLYYHMLDKSMDGEQEDECGAVQQRLSADTGEAVDRSLLASMITFYNGL